VRTDQVGARFGDTCSGSRLPPRRSVLSGRLAQCASAGQCARVRGWLLNLYSRALAPFTDESSELAQIFAQQAAVTLTDAEVYWRTYALTQNPEAALDNRDRIGQARGVLIAFHKITGDGAFELLRRTSQNLNIRLSDVADHVVLTGQLPANPN
jgi:hypothetical protein